MIDYDDIRGNIPVQLIMQDIEQVRRMLKQGHALDGFRLRRLDSDDIRSLKASVDIGLALLRKVMPDLKSEDLNTIRGRERLSFLSDIQARMTNPNIAESERRAFQLGEVLTAVSEQRISIEEAVKIQALLNPKQSDDGPTFAVVPISDRELKQRLMHYDRIH